MCKNSFPNSSQSQSSSSSSSSSSTSWRRELGYAINNSSQHLMSLIAPSFDSGGGSRCTAAVIIIRPQQSTNNERTILTDFHIWNLSFTLQVVFFSRNPKLWLWSNESSFSVNSNIETRHWCCCWWCCSPLSTFVCGETYSNLSTPSRYTPHQPKPPQRFVAGNFGRFTQSTP